MSKYRQSYHEKELRAVAEIVRDHCRMEVGMGRPEDREAVVRDHNDHLTTIENAIIEDRGRSVYCFQPVKIRRIALLLVAACLLSGCAEIDSSRTWTSPTERQPMPYYTLRP